VVEGVVHPEDVFQDLKIEEKMLYRESEAYLMRYRVFWIFRVVLLLVSIPPIVSILLGFNRPSLFLPVAPLLVASLFWNRLKTLFQSNVSIIIFSGGLSLTLISVFFELEGGRAVFAAIVSSLILLFYLLYFYLGNWIIKLKSRYSMITPTKHVHVTGLLILSVLFVNCIIFTFFPNKAHRLNFVSLPLGILMVVCSMSFTTQLGEYSKVSVYLYDNSVDSSIYPFKKVNTHTVDEITWLEGGCYWVYRFMYHWLWELTLSWQFPFFMKRDYERFEVWINAHSRDVEWLVTDYHYRELWYRPVNKGYTIHIDWDDNFHTIVPFNNELQIEYYRELSKIGMTGWNRYFELQSRLDELQSEISEKYGKLHSSADLDRYFRRDEKRAVQIIYSLPWEEIRYEYGAYNKGEGRKRYDLNIDS